MFFIYAISPVQISKMLQKRTEFSFTIAYFFFQKIVFFVTEKSCEK